VSDSTQASGGEHSYEREELVDLLAAEPLFSTLPGDAVADLIAACEVFDIEGGSYLVRAGDRLTCLYGVLSGGLRITHPTPEGGEQVLAELYRGQLVGLFEMFVDTPLIIDISVMRDSTLLRLSAASFFALIQKHPAVLRAMARAMSERALLLLQETVAATSQRKGNYALIPLSPEAREGGLRRLVEIMEADHGVKCVTSELVSAALGEAACERDDARTTEWLSRLERGTNALLYECDLEHPAWMARCVRQSDRLVIVTRPGTNARIGDAITAIRLAHRGGVVRRIELVVVHPRSTTLPSGTREWAHLPDVHRIHHVREDERGDYARVARHMIGKPIGVVLGGGGARGMAHLGVLAAVNEAGIPIDCICGTSMGAIVAAGLAQGWSVEHMREAVGSVFARRLALYDPTIPISSLLAGKKLDGVMRELYGDTFIEDLWLPFFCVSTDLTCAEPLVHDSGSLCQAVRASCSIPGMFPPVVSDGRVLVDGGLMDNLPIDLFSSRFAGPILAVDVFPYGDPTLTAPPGPIASRLHKLRESVHRRHMAPPLFDSLMRSTLVGSRFRLQTVMPHMKNLLYLKPPVASFGILHWGAHEALYEAGYRYASEALAREARTFRDNAA
jgi:predicted acylesterase/phospholipase RssA/CRP-like cAMP-binding protein